MPCLFLMCCAVVLSERCVPLRYFYGTDYLFYHFAQFVWKRVLSLAQASHSGFDMCISCGGKKWRKKGLLSEECYAFFNRMVHSMPERHSSWNALFSKTVY